MNELPRKTKRSFKSRLYFFSYKVHARLISRKQSPLWTGFWLGMLDCRDFHGVDDALYEENAMYRDAEHNGRGLFAWETKCLDDYFPSTGLLLVIGMGGGREVLSLAKLGYHVEGYECNTALLEFAAAFLSEQQCEETVSFIARDCAPTGDSFYAGAIVGWGAYMMILGRQRRIEFLQTIRGRLKEGSPILLSFFTRAEQDPHLRVAHLQAPHLQSPHLSAVRDIGSRLRRQRHREEVELGDDLGPNYIHRFTHAEIEDELREAGFSLAFYKPQGPRRFDSGHAVGLAR